MDASIVPSEFRADLKRAIEVLQEHGATEVYVFGSVVHPWGESKPNDIDIAVSGLPPRRFLHAYGILLGELEHRFDLVDLDSDDRLSRTIQKRGKLERVA
jgi:predicted nucleotidyltransferase